MRPGSRRHAKAKARARREERRAPGRGSGLAWTGAISFGLVNIPVTLHSAESTKELHFTMLDRSDLSPIGYRKVNKNTGEEVPAARIVKGYRVDEDRYVTVTDEDIKRASPERTQRIDLHHFVDACQIDPAQFERPYHLEPAAKSDKAYALLREAMKRTDKIGIATIVLRARQHLCALVAQGPVIVLVLLRYRAELRDPGHLRLPAEEPAALHITPEELKMAERLVAELSGPWKPESFKDDYRGDLLAFIEKKAKAGAARAGRPAPEKKERAAPSGDIMALLKKSLAVRHGAGA